ncbi:MAG: acyl-CoA dehydrogenase family protein, partial [Pseudomonadota bacterium]
MDFSLNDDQRALQDTVRRFAQTELPEIAKAVERNDEPVSREIVHRYAELGLLGVNLPTAYGGGGMSHLDAVLVLEEVAKVSIAVAFPIFESSFGPTLALAHFGPEDLKQRVLPKVCSGDMMIAVSMSEPNAGSALTDLTTTAKVDGDDVVLNGQKRWSSGGSHADAYVVYCRMSDAPGAKGIGAVLVEDCADGFTFGKREQHMGFRGVASAD